MKTSLLFTGTVLMLMATLAAAVPTNRLATDMIDDGNWAWGEEGEEYGTPAAYPDSDLDSETVPDTDMGEPPAYTESLRPLRPVAEWSPIERQVYHRVLDEINQPQLVSWPHRVVAANDANATFVMEAMASLPHQSAVPPQQPVSKQEIETAAMEFIEKVRENNKKITYSGWPEKKFSLDDIYGGFKDKLAKGLDVWDVQERTAYKAFVLDMSLTLPLPQLVLRAFGYLNARLPYPGGSVEEQIDMLWQWVRVGEKMPRNIVYMVVRLAFPKESADDGWSQQAISHEQRQAERQLRDDRKTALLSLLEQESLSTRSILPLVEKVRDMSMSALLDQRNAAKKAAFLQHKEEKRAKIEAALDKWMASEDRAVDWTYIDGRGYSEMYAARELYNDVWDINRGQRGFFGVSPSHAQLAEEERIRIQLKKRMGVVSAIMNVLAGPESVASRKAAWLPLRISPWTTRQASHLIASIFIPDHAQKDIDMDDILLQKIGYEASAVRVYENLDEIADGNQEENLTAFRFVEQVWPKFVPLAAHDLIAGPATVRPEQVNQIGHILRQIKGRSFNNPQVQADVVSEGTRAIMSIMYRERLPLYSSTN